MGSCSQKAFLLQRVSKGFRKEAAIFPSMRRNIGGWEGVCSNHPAPYQELIRLEDVLMASSWINDCR